MSIFLSGGKKVKSIFADANGKTKKIVSAWVNKDGLPVKVFSVGGGRFVTISSGGQSYYSLDGETWIAMSGLSTSYSYKDVTYGNDRFVIVGSGGQSYYSLDGETWVAMSGLSTSYSYNGVTYGNGRFVAVGNYTSSVGMGMTGYYNYSKIYFSDDGVNWQSSKLDLRNYSTSATPYRVLQDVTYGNGRFVTVGYNGISYYSLDGETWVAMSSWVDNTYYNGVTYGNGRFVAVGDNGCVDYSLDGETWTYKALGSSVYLSRVSYANGNFVTFETASTTKYAYYSSDGVTWIRTKLEVALYGVTYGNGRFVTVGSGGQSYYSLDGETWVAMSGLSTDNVFRVVVFSIDGGYDNS